MTFHDDNRPTEPTARSSTTEPEPSITFLEDWFLPGYRVSGDDPITDELGDSRDLYDVTTWEPRNTLDRTAIRVADVVHRHRKELLVGLFGLVIVMQIALVTLVLLTDFDVLFYSVLSIVPALLVAVWVWGFNGTPRKAVKPLLLALALGFLSGGLAILLNNSLTGIVGGVLVAPLAAPWTEEIGKLLCVWLVIYLYGREHFERVVDAAVFGAVAGLGFATMENALYIIQDLEAAIAANPNVGISVEQKLQVIQNTAAVRATVAPGHVLWTAIAGYFTGLAVFNRANRGPIVAKGLLIAMGLHFLNNVVGPLQMLTGGTAGIALLRFVGLALSVWVLYTLVTNYRDAYTDAFGERQTRGRLSLRHSVPEPASTANGGTVGSTAVQSTAASVSHELVALKELHEGGLLTDEEYEEKRQRLIDRL